MRKEILIFIAIAVILVLGIVLSNFYFKGEVKQNEQNETINIEDNTQIPNPAGRYCHLLGYKTRINETKEGQQGICIFPDGSECDDWWFYAGLCGQNWSYCEQHGYISKIKNDSKDNYSGIGIVVCVNKSTGIEIGQVSDLSNLTRSLSRPADSNLPPG